MNFSINLSGEGSPKELAKSLRALSQLITETDVEKLDRLNFEDATLNATLLEAEELQHSLLRPKS